MTFKAFPKNGWYLCALIFLFLLFIGESVYFALQNGVGMDITQDENYHLFLIRLFHDMPGFVLQNTEESLFYGNVTHVPYLYHLLLGKLLHFNIFSLTDLIFIRLVSVLLSCGTLLFSWLTFRLVSKDKSTEIVAVAILVSCLGYLFVSSAVSYDALLNFLVAGAVYCLISFSMRNGYWHAWGFIVFSLLAGLTKLSFLPLGSFLFVAGCLIIFLKYKRKNLPALPRNPIALFLSFLVVVMLSSLNFHLYGMNLIVFHRIEPNCEQVMPAEDCAKTFNYFRAHRYDDSAPVTLAYQGFSYLLEWRKQMQEKILGLYVVIRACSADDYFSRLIYLHSLPIISRTFSGLQIIVLFIALFAALAKLTKVKIKRTYIPTTPEVVLCALLFCGYIAILIPINYEAYSVSGNFHTTLRARYLFPVLPLGIIVLAHFLLKYIPWKWRGYLVAPFLLLAIWNVLPSFHSDPEHKYLLKDAPLPPGPCNATQMLCGEIPSGDWQYCNYQSAIERAMKRRKNDTNESGNI